MSIPAVIETFVRAGYAFVWLDVCASICIESVLIVFVYLPCCRLVCDEVNSQIGLGRG